MQLTAEQVLAQLKQTGTYDSMRQELLSEFTTSAQGQAFDKTVRTLLQRLSEDADTSRAGDKRAYFERRLVEQLKHNGRMDRMERDARNHWLSPERHPKLSDTIARAVSQLRDARAPAKSTSSVATRALEVDPPRLPSNGARSVRRSHNYYRRGDSVAAFVPTESVLCRTETGYICLTLDIEACDSVRNMYTVRDANAGVGGQRVWAVYWDQILAIKRPYEQVYRRGDQVYALFRDDYGDTSVSTEFYPARVDEVGRTSLCVRFDAGSAVAHVYYDEVFAAGRVGFMRQMSEARKRSGAADALVEANGRLVPSFTGFWPGTAEPGVSKYGRKPRFRQMPPILVEHGTRDANMAWNQQHQQQQEALQQRPQIVYNPDVGASPGQHSSDMEIDSSATSPSPPRIQPVVAADSKPEPKLEPEVKHNPAVSAVYAAQPNDAHTRTTTTSTATAKPPVKTPSSEEEGEIDTGTNEEGELDERAGASAWPARTPELRELRPAYRSPDRPAYRSPSRPPYRSPSRSSSRYSGSRWRQRSPHHERRTSRSRSRSRWSNRSRDRSRTSRYERGRDFSSRRDSGRYRDEYRPRYRSRSRSMSRDRAGMRGMSPPGVRGRSPPFQQMPFGAPPPPPPPLLPPNQVPWPYPPTDSYAPPGGQYRRDYR